MRFKTIVATPGLGVGRVRPLASLTRPTREVRGHPAGPAMATYREIRWPPAGRWHGRLQGDPDVSRAHGPGRLV